MSFSEAVAAERLKRAVGVDGGEAGRVRELFLRQRKIENAIAALASSLEPQR